LKGLAGPQPLLLFVPGCPKTSRSPLPGAPTAMCCLTTGPKATGQVTMDGNLRPRGKTHLSFQGECLRYWSQCQKGDHQCGICLSVCRPGASAHACNPGYSGDRDGQGHGLRPPLGEKVVETPSQPMALAAIPTAKGSVNRIAVQAILSKTRRPPSPK
jgi:hypothetical protein